MAARLTGVAAAGDGAPIAVARGWTLFAALALAAGVALRAWQLDSQVLLDDEWHALHKLLRADWAGVFTRFGYADHSIPLTLYYKWVYESFGLTERQMRAPMLLAGIALLAVAPWLGRAWAPWPTRALWIGLLAVSPLLVYHSRTARPYALTSLLTFVAIAAYWRWRRAQGAAPLLAAAYIVPTWLAGWLHPITLPFTLAPFVFDTFLVARGVQASAAPSLRRLAALGALTALALAATLAPPLIVDWLSLSAKGGRDWVTPESLYRTALMLAGTAHPTVLLAIAVLSAAGVASIARRDRFFVAYVLTIGVCGVAATILARPEWIHHPLVAARYVIPLLPFLLLFAAEGVGAALGLLRPWWRPLVALTLAAAYVAQGPLPAQWPRPSQFSGHLRYQFDYDHAHNPYVTRIPHDPIPAFYRRLAGLPPGSRTLIEAPWRLESHFNPHPWYQDVHRQHVRIGFVTPVCGERDFGEYPEDRRLPMRGFAHVAALLRGETRGADYLVLHPRPWKTPPDAVVEWPEIARCVAAAEAAFGEPVHRDADTIVFALRPERRAAP
jgi:hypothetical protein